MQDSRLFRIVYYLLDKGKCTAPELADKFEVSTRTIYRDLDVISAAGIPIYATQGKGGGISILPEYVMDNALLSDEEKEKIVMALQGIAVTDETTDDLLSKLGALFQTKAENWIEVDFSDWIKNNPDRDIFNSIKTAILEDERYIGSYVIGRRAVIEVGGTRSRRKDRDKWFIIPDHHPAIVDKELFEKVQAVQRRFSLPTRKARDYPLKGKVYCGCCDHALSRITQKKPFYMCRHALCSPFALVSKKQQIPHQRDGGGIRTLGLRFALPKNPGPGVTGAYFPFYTCRRRSIDAAIFAPKKQQIPHQRDGVVSLPSA